MKEGLQLLKAFYGKQLMICLMLSALFVSLLSMNTAAQQTSIHALKYEGKPWPALSKEQRMFMPSLWALDPQGPEPVKAVWTEGKLRVWFSRVGKGLTGAGVKVGGWTLDGKQKAEGKVIAGRMVEIEAAQMPAELFYGWQPNSKENLYNSEGIPASNFRIRVERVDDPRRKLADTLFSTYYHQRASLMRQLPVKEGEIIFLGNSITDGGEWAELFTNRKALNFGISGDHAQGIIYRLDDVVRRKPAKVFLMIGVNDLARGRKADSLICDLEWIAMEMKRRVPQTKLYIQSILPVNDVYGKFDGHTSKGSQILRVNTWLNKHAEWYGYTYVDLHTHFTDSSGKMDKRYTNDGLHLLGEGYKLWKHLLWPYVYDLNDKPALLPLPRHLRWTGERFPIYAVSSARVDAGFEKAGAALKDQLGMALTDAGEEKIIVMKTSGFPEEGYSLHVGNDGVVIRASHNKGAYYGVMTLLQLNRDGAFIPGCTIEDRPAFSWRGYMVDVGRNYQDLQQLMQQIHVMTRYKLNVFHFHLTEDIAWRLEVPGYPQLTAPEAMTRNTGSYYSVEDIKALMRYCEDRNILFLPEIDMPGHSAAFERAMGVGMQSEEGKKHLQDILTRVIKTYGFRNMHIGGDEVKIRDSSFLPVMIRHLNAMGVQTIGWDPGGNIGDSTIRQLWMKDGVKNKAYRYIDSRHLYLNHMDPLEAVSTIYQRRLGNRDSADANLPGATLCLWHDRNVKQKEDLLIMNPVYPGMLAFAEKAWRGGGEEGWTAVTPSTPQFSEFEERLLNHRNSLMRNMPFPYWKQADVVWELMGPYGNGGDAEAVFPPERGPVATTKKVVGGTVVLKHFWHPLVKGAVNLPRDSETWYARRMIWSEADSVRDARVGFNNHSRSYLTDAPPAGKWNERNAKVFVNGEPLPAPLWKRAGQKTTLEHPFEDEGYEYRVPTRVKLKYGWNEVLMKLPSGGSKYMFTFVLD
jgi:hexosaminidase